MYPLAISPHSPSGQEEARLHEGLGGRPVPFHSVADEGGPGCGYDSPGSCARHCWGDVDAPGPVSCDVVL